MILIIISIFLILLFIFIGYGIYQITTEGTKLGCKKDEIRYYDSDKQLKCLPIKSKCYNKIGQPKGIIELDPKDKLTCLSPGASCKKGKVLNFACVNEGDECDTNSDFMGKIENGECQEEYCFKVNGVGVPKDYLWYDDKSKIVMSNIDSIKQAYANDSIILQNGIKAKSNGYKYLAVTVVDGTSCGLYYLFGKTIPTSDSMVDNKFCAYKPGSISAGTKLDSKCSKFTFDKDQPAGVTTWKIYKLE